MDYFFLCKTTTLLNEILLNWMRVAFLFSCFLLQTRSHSNICRLKIFSLIIYITKCLIFLYRISFFFLYICYAHKSLKITLNGILPEHFGEKHIIHLLLTRIKVYFFILYFSSIHMLYIACAE